MMKELYTEDQLSVLQSSSKRYVFMAAGVLAVSFAVCVVVCFFVDAVNATWLKALNIALSGVGGCVALYLLFDCILPTFARRNYLARLLVPVGQTVTGFVEDTGRESTVSRYVSARELKLTDDKGRVSLLYWEKQVPLPELDGKTVTFRTVQNRIVAYEVTE